MNSKGILVVACVLGLAIPAVSHAQDQAPLTPPPGNDSTLPERGDSQVFLDRAIEMSYAAVELGQLAAARGENPKVKSYAEVLVKDYAAALEKFQKFRTEAAPPRLNSEHTKLKESLSEKSGPSFDREYVEAMVRDTQSTIRLFEQQILWNSTGESSNRSSPLDTDVTRLVRELLPTMQEHLELGEQIQMSLPHSAD
jgi:putative membrane protein